MRRDQKLAKKKKARAQARTSARADSGFSLAKAATKPFGPCWLSRSWRDDGLPPELVSVVISRDLGSLYVAHVMLVDRTCFGVKNAFTVGPFTRRELLETVTRVGRAHDDGMESASPEDAQSVVFAAVAYAARLGLRPSRDFDARLVGPAPSSLKPTPLAARERPFYVPGPDDDVVRILGALRRAVGEHGFDVGTDVDDGDADDGDADEKREDELEIADAIGAAFSALAQDGELPEGEVALEQFLLALGLEDDVLPPEHETSLPSVWTALFRPLANGTRGVDLMRKRRPKDAAFAALAETRAVLFEVLSVVGAVGICRDLLTGETLRVRLGVVATRATRWMRFFAYLTPMSDGTLYPASTMLGHAWLRNVAVEAWLAKLNALLEELDVDERIDPANPTHGLTRWGALAHAVLHGMIAPSAEESEERSRPLYLVDSDGDRFELHEATIPLAPDVERTLCSALDRADDFAAGDGFAWMREPKERGVIAGEHVAFIEPPELGAIRVTTTSVARFEAVCARLEALAGARLVPSCVNVVRPWEQMPGAVAVETPESRRLVFGSSRVAAGEIDMDRVVIDGVRRALDEDVPMLGGHPRDLVTDEDGRGRVERWLQDQELRGMPTGNAFLDLDAVRRELGLPGAFPLDGAAVPGVPDRKISETILEFAQPILDPLGAQPELAEARRALDLAVGVWNFHAMATPRWGKPEYLAEARAKMRGPGMPPALGAIFETLLARRASLYGDDLRVVGEWSLGPDGRGGHSFRCDARLPQG
ncbi:MAG: hypothetical protein KF795_09040 [Labilithrix sp.]|nr:hypothetical protein [Labilithrix sp.]